jgi:hypothetical protein
MKSLPALALCFACASPAPALAEEPGTGFWGGIDGGVASLKRSYSVSGDVSDTNFAMSLRAGFAWHPQLLLGVELGGWLLQASDYNVDPSQGEAVEAFLVFAQYYPGRSSPWFVKGGLGAARYWTNHAGEGSGSGSAAMLGFGRDFRMSDSWSITAAADYSAGNLDGLTSPPGVTQDARYRALTFRVGLTYR